MLLCSNNSQELITGTEQEPKSKYINKNIKWEKLKGEKSRNKLHYCNKNVNNIWTFKLKDRKWHNVFQITLMSKFNWICKCAGSVAQGYLYTQHNYQNTQVQLHNQQEQDRKDEVCVLIKHNNNKSVDRVA